MGDKIALAVSMLNLQLILLSAILFILGLVLADSVLEKNIRWLIAYPLWIYSHLENLLEKFSSVILLFFFILFFNTLNLFIGFASGFLILAPLALAVWTGLNVGIVLRQTVQTGSMWLLFLNPVALFELPASWISFAMGIEMGMIYLQKHDYSLLISVFRERMMVFIWIVIPLLALAGLIEAAMINYVRKNMDDHTADD